MSNVRRVYVEKKEAYTVKAKELQSEIRSYLGGFTGVCVPPSVFYLAHGKINAAGLVYPEKENLFRIKFFAAPLENGKISNIVPVGE